MAELVDAVNQAAARERLHVEHGLPLVLHVLAEPRGTVALVSNEVGLGIVPDNALARRFRDLAGTTNQRLAAAADTVVFLAAGLPVVLKPSSS